MKKILVSVVIPSYNGKKTIGKLLKRLEQLSGNYSIEIIDIDSSSTDGTVEILNIYKKRFKNFKIIRIPKSSFNHGDTRNLGVKIAKGEFVCFFSQDAIPIKENDFIKYLLEDFNLDKRVVAVFGKQIPYKNTPIIQKIEVERRFQELDKYTDQNGKLIFDLEKKFTPLNEKNELLWFSLFNTFSCYRRSFLIKKPFSKVRYGEDLLMGKEILNMNFMKVYDSRVKVIHSHVFNLKEYYKREKEDVQMRSGLSSLTNKTHFVSKLKMVFYLKINVFRKTYYILELFFYYFIKLLIYSEIFLKRVLS